MRFYCMEINSVMLITVTPSHTMNVKKCGVSGQANTTCGPMPRRSPIQYGRLNYIRAYMYVHTERTRQNLSHSHNIIWLLHTEVVWHTSQSLHAIWSFPTRPHRDCGGIGFVMAFERWVSTNEISIFFYVKISTILMSENRGVTHTNKFHFGII